MISVLWVCQVLAPSFQRLYSDHKYKQALKSARALIEPEPRRCPLTGSPD